MYVLLLETIALVGGTVHTMEPAAAAAAATVLIEDGRITAVGADLAIPDGATVIDVAGLHVVPGLLDGSVTFDAEHDALYLSAGVTTVRDIGSPIGSMIPEATATMRDRNPGPSLLVASPVFADATSGTPGAFLLGEPSQAAEQIAEVVDLLGKAKAAVDYFAIDRYLAADRHAVVCGAARAYGVEVWGPLPAGMTPAQARGHGQRSLVGIDSLLAGDTRFESLEDLAPLEPIIASLAKDGWRVEPLLMGTARILRSMELEGEPEVLAALGGTYDVAWRADLENFGLIRAAGGQGPVEAAITRQREFVMALFDSGVQLVPASGAPSGGIAPGAGLVDELEEWSLAGVPAADILRLATADAARALGAEDRGRIAPGLVADLLVLGSDPQRSIAALRRPEIVVLRGKVIERFELDEAVDALKARQAAIRKQRSRPILVERPPMPDGKLVLDGMANLVTYGSRTAVERYTVVELEDGRRAYGARVRILATGAQPGREMVVAQLIQDKLVERFELTLDTLDDQGRPQVDENGEHAFHARGQRVTDSKKLGMERFRFGVRIDNQRAEEAIAAVDGSAVLLGLIAALEFPEGPSFVLGFDGVAMEPLVDRIHLNVSDVDGRLEMSDTRGARVFGLGAKGKLLFAARAQAGGRLDVEPAALPGADAVHALQIPDERVFTGDPARWAEGPRPANAETGGDDDR